MFNLEASAIKITKRINHGKVAIHEFPDGSILIEFKLKKDKWNYKPDLKNGLLYLYPK